MSYESGNAKILIISGATASGKSSLALKIAQEKNGVIINADAMQLYKELPILSAQPSEDDLKLAPHFLYSTLKHNQNSSLAIWLDLAIEQINLALKNNQLPIVVGGTGLYLSKLIDGINKIPKIDPSLTKKIRQISDKKDLIKELKDLGETFDGLEVLDKQRLARRLEVFQQTGESLSWWQDQPNEIFYPKEYFKHHNIEIPRSDLYQNCDSRLESMIGKGAIREVESLLEKDLSDDSLITKTIGFSQIRDFLERKITIDEAINIASQKTRNYAKRQLTWFKNQFKYD
ncbi:MAG: tRNA dimethylallyltransferase [Myxococcota bacterium]|jgi:tRNA dimethylallyltransferase